MAIGRIPEPGTGIPESILDAKGDLISASAADTPARLAVGTNETRLVAASGETAGLKWVADTTNYAIAAKGDLLVGTAADTVGVLGVGTNGYTIVADSAETTGLKWAAVAAGGGYTLINSGGTSLSGTATTVSSIGGYTHLFFVIEGASRSSGSGTEYWLRFNSDSSSNYAWGSFGSFNNATANSCGFNKGDTVFKIGFRYGSTTNFNDGNYSSGWVYRYGSTDDKAVNVTTWGTDGTPNTTPFITYTMGAYNTSSAITSITVGADSSLNGGKIFVYGVN